MGTSTGGGHRCTRSDRAGVAGSGIAPSSRAGDARWARGGRPGRAILLRRATGPRVLCAAGDRSGVPTWGLTIAEADKASLWVLAALAIMMQALQLSSRR